MYRFGGFLVIVAFCVAMAPSAVAIEGPAFTVIAEFEDVEVRRYDPYVVAGVTVRGKMDKVGNRAFQPLFGYISGGNASGQKIEMTAPVEQLPVGDAYQVRFVMPADLKMPSLPAPRDARVTLDEVAGGLVAVVTYSGGWGTRNYQRHEAKLLQGLRGSGYVVCGEPRWARFNPPFWPRFLRRNEVQVPVALGQCDTALEDRIGS